MGILNITPDSFSDGGEFYDPQSAIKHALKMVKDGADILDIGGESTRPGAQHVAIDEQLRRVIPVLEALKDKLEPEVPISIDTTQTSVVHAAFNSGARIINDISAGEDDSNMFKTAAEYGCPLILMHKQGSPATMQDAPAYDNVVEEIRSYLMDRAQLAIESGVIKKNIIIDPGIGFGKTYEQNIAIINNLKSFVDTGFTVLLGASRKKVLQQLSHMDNAGGLIGATCATTVMAVMAGVQIVRVHDVKQNKQALEVADAMRGF